MNKIAYKSAVGAIALVTASMTSAQHMGHMPGMTMPSAKTPVAKNPTVKRPAAKKPTARTIAKRPVANMPARARSAMDNAAAKPAPVVDHSQTDMSRMGMVHPEEPAAPPAPVDHGQMQVGTPATATSVDHGQMDMSKPGTAAMAGMDHGAGGHAAMRGALGIYPSTREASGTAWQPDAAEHRGYMLQAGDWMLMLHGNLDLVADT